MGQAIGKNASLFRSLTEMAMHSFNSVGSVNDFSDFISILKKTYNREPHTTLTYSCSKINVMMN